MGSEEFNQFKAVLLEKLPVTFRVNPGLLQHQQVVQMFTDEDLVRKMATQGVDEKDQMEVSNNHGDHPGKDQLRKATLNFEQMKCECK